MQEYIDAVNLDVIITEIGIFVAGFAAILGIWLERDHSKPPRYAWWLSLLILLCTFVGMFQTLADAKEGAKLETDMARMLSTLDKIAQNSDVEIPELNEFVKSEVSAQARSNPDVVKKVAQRVADEGGDPAEMLGSYLPASEVQNVARRGALNTKSAKVARPATAGGGDNKDADGGDKPVLKRRKLEFGGKSKVREPDSGSDRKSDGDGPARVKLGGRDDDDKGKDDKKDDDKKDDDKDAKDDDKEPKRIKLGGKDDDDKGKPAGSSAPAAGKPVLGGPAKPPGGGGLSKPPGGGAPPPAGGLKKPGAGK